MLDELLRHKDMLISEARNYLARYLCRGDDVFSQVGTLSGGERARLALAILVLEQANFLPVSYTHLDVYKRQGLACAGPMGGQFAPSRPFFTSFFLMDRRNGCNL